MTPQHFRKVQPDKRRFWSWDRFSTQSAVNNSESAAGNWVFNDFHRHFSAIVRFENRGDRDECSINPGLTLHAHTIIDLRLKNSRIGKDWFCKGLELACCCILFLNWYLKPSFFRVSAACNDVFSWKKKPMDAQADSHSVHPALSIFPLLTRANQTNRVFGWLIPEMTYFGVSTRLLRQFYFSDNAIQSYKFSQEL